MNASPPMVLDFRLMLGRQPTTALLLAAILVLFVWLLTHASADKPQMPISGADPARVVAAQRNFQSILIPSSGLAKAQQVILDSAASHQLRLGQVDYTQEVEGDSGFSRSTMTIPVTGSYADIRAFIASALMKQPALLIRHLSIQQESSTEGAFALKATLTVEFLIERLK